MGKWPAVPRILRDRASRENCGGYSMPEKFAVLGDGAWGTALALLLAQNTAHRVCLWSAREENARILREKRENVRLLPGVPIPKTIDLTTDPAAALADARLAVCAIPTIYLRQTMGRFVACWPASLPALSLAKGIENESFQRPSQILREALGLEALAVLSGPSHAEEVSRGQPTSVVVASADDDLAHHIQQAFTTDRFRVYTNPDVLGVELAGALKNVIGIAAGICDGLNFGDNAKSALLTRALVEMARFGVALGAEHETFFGLAGIGDLITTCISPHGRNRKVGERLGRGEKLADILTDTPKVAEGVYTARSVWNRTRSMGIELPIMTEVYRVLYDNKPPLAAVQALMLRQPKKESRS
jgi:glycerol-3-phosphate dehydrogenase (NAD(P)+)